MTKTGHTWLMEQISERGHTLAAFARSIDLTEDGLRKAISNGTMRARDAGRAAAALEISLAEFYRGTGLSEPENILREPEAEYTARPNDVAQANDPHELAGLLWREREALAAMIKEHKKRSGQ